MSTATEDGNLKNEIEGRDLKAIIKNVDSKSLLPFSVPPPLPRLRSSFHIFHLSTSKGHTRLMSVSEEMQSRAVEITSSALTQYNLERDIAMFIKKEFDRIYGTTWHCVVGKK
jgi:hypothetical protein